MMNSALCIFEQAPFISKSMVVSRKNAHKGPLQSKKVNAHSNFHHTLLNISINIRYHMDNSNGLPRGFLSMLPLFCPVRTAAQPQFYYPFTSAQYHKFKCHFDLLWWPYYLLLTTSLPHHWCRIYGTRYWVFTLHLNFPCIILRYAR